jgi:hypothetical protein
MEHVKVGDLVIINQPRPWRAPWRPFAGPGFITSWSEGDETLQISRRGGAGAYVLFTDGREIWFDDDEFEVVSESR